MTGQGQKNSTLIMAIFSIIGGVIGYIAGMFWMSPSTLIPIGVVIGIAVGLAYVNRGKKDPART